MTKKKKILMVVTTDVVSDMRVRKVADFLVNYGFDVEIIGRKTKGSFSLDNYKFKLTQMKLIFNKGFLFYAEFSVRFFILGLFKRFDVVVANDLDTLLPSYILSKLKSSNLVYDSHEYFTESVGLQGRKFQKTFWNGIEKNILPRVKLAYTVSEPIKEIYTKKYDVNFRLVRNFPTTELNLCKVEDFDFNYRKIILYQGVFNPGRNLDMMIEAMQYVENAVFVLIGYGEQENVLKSLVLKFELSEKVIFLGKKEYSEMMNYTFSSDLGIALEKPLGDSFKFSLPNKVFDYTYAGLPFVSFGTQEVKKVIDNFKLGEIISFSNAKELSSEVSRILNNKTLLDEIKSNQEKFKHLFTWENECIELTKVYETLI